MSFSLSATYPSRDAAQTALGLDPLSNTYSVTMPGPVRKFLLEALNAVKDGESVKVEAFGHLWTPSSLRTSDCRLRVTPIEAPVIRPKVAASADAGADPQPDPLDESQAGDTDPREVDPLKIEGNVE